MLFVFLKIPCWELIGVDKVTETDLDLKAGRILGTVKKMSTASRYEVKIPNGVAGIRGTVYHISADGVLSVLSGSVILSYVGPDGNPVTTEVKAGQQFDAKTGQITTIPESILREALLFQGELVGGAAPPTTFIAPDKTIYVVSPTTAQNGALQQQGGVFTEGAGLAAN
jgi:hypothetical protein